MVDKDSIKKKLDSLMNRGKRNQQRFSDDRWFPPKDKKSQIRLVDNPFGEDPFIELHFHYRVAGKKTVLCLERNFGKECPICEEGRKLAKSDLKEDKELGKKLIPRERYFAYMIDRADEEPKVKLWGFGVTVYKKLLNALLDDDYCNFLSPSEGLDATVEVVQAEDKSYPDTEFNFKRKESKLAPTAKEVKAIMATAKQINEVFQPMSAVQIRKLLEDWLSFGDDDDNDGTIKGGEKKEEPTKDVEDAFNEALKEIE